MSLTTLATYSTPSSSQPSSSFRLLLTHGSIIHYTYPPNPHSCAIVNSTGVQFAGVDGAISSAGGSKLYEDRTAALANSKATTTFHSVNFEGIKGAGGGERVAEGEAILCGPNSYGSLKVQYVIHAYGGYSDDAIRSAYLSSLECAESAGIEAIAFSLISAGSHRRGLDAIRIGLKTLKNYGGYSGLKEVCLVAYTTVEAEALGRFAKEIFIAKNNLSGVGGWRKRATKVKERLSWPRKRESSSAGGGGAVDGGNATANNNVGEMDGRKENTEWVEEVIAEECHNDQGGGNHINNNSNNNIIMESGGSSDDALLAAALASSNDAMIAAALANNHPPLPSQHQQQPQLTTQQQSAQDIQQQQDNISSYTIATYKISAKHPFHLILTRGSIIEFSYPPNPSKSGIVNASTSLCIGDGTGVDRAIGEAGGVNLLKDRRKLVVGEYSVQHEGYVRCKDGEAVVTGPGRYGRLNVSHVIHANGGSDHDSLTDAYNSSLECAKSAQLEAIALPLLSSGGLLGDRSLEEVVGTALKTIKWFDGYAALKIICIFVRSESKAELLAKVAQEVFNDERTARPRRSYTAPMNAMNDAMNNATSGVKRSNTAPSPAAIAPACSLVDTMISCQDWESTISLITVPHELHHDDEQETDGGDYSNTTSLQVQYCPHPKKKKEPGMILNRIMDGEKMKLMAEEERQGQFMATVSAIPECDDGNNDASRMPSLVSDTFEERLRRKLQEGSSNSNTKNNNTMSSHYHQEEGAIVTVPAIPECDERISDLSNYTTNIMNNTRVHSSQQQPSHKHSQKKKQGTLLNRLARLDEKRMCQEEDDAIITISAVPEDDDDDARVDHLFNNSFTSSPLPNNKKVANNLHGQKQQLPLIYNRLMSGGGEKRCQNEDSNIVVVPLHPQQQQQHETAVPDHQSTITNNSNGSTSSTSSDIPGTASSTSSTTTTSALRPGSLLKEKMGCQNDHYDDSIIVEPILNNVHPPTMRKRSDNSSRLSDSISSSMTGLQPGSLLKEKMSQDNNYDDHVGVTVVPFPPREQQQSMRTSAYTQLDQHANNESRISDMHRKNKPIEAAITSAAPSAASSPAPLKHKSSSGGGGRYRKKRLAPKIIMNEHSIEYTNTGFRDKDILGTVAEVLEKGTLLRLEKLYMDGNRLKLLDARFTRALGLSSCRLKLIQLEDNRIGLEGARRLGDALILNESIERVYLGHNELGDEGVAQIASALQVNRTVKRMDLHHNGIGDCGAESMAEAIMVNQTLQSVDLRRNHIGDDGASCLVDALQSNVGVEKLEVSSNQISEHLQQRISDILIAGLPRRCSSSTRKKQASSELFYAKLMELKEDSSDLSDLEVLSRCITDVHVMKFFYTAVAMIQRLGVLTKDDASLYIQSGLDRGLDNCCFCSESRSCFNLILEKAKDDGYIEQHDLQHFSDRAEGKGMENASFVADLMQSVRSNTTQIKGLEANAEAITHSLCVMKDGLKDGLERQRKIEAAVGFLSTTLNAISFSVGGGFLSAALNKMSFTSVGSSSSVPGATINETVGSIVDYSDLVHVEQLAAQRGRVCVEQVAMGVELATNECAEKLLFEAVRDHSILTVISAMAAMINLHCPVRPDDCFASDSNTDETSGFESKKEEVVTQHDEQKQSHTKETAQEEVMQWLSSHLPRLQNDDAKKYCEQLIQDGFDSLDILAEVTEEDLSFMKKGHSRTLIKRMRDGGS